MHVTFQMKDAKTNLGQSLYLVGNKVELGEWNVSDNQLSNLHFIQMKNAIQMQTNGQLYPQWQTFNRVYIPDFNHAKNIQYKYFIQNQDVRAFILYSISF